MSDRVYWLWTWLLERAQMVCNHDPSEVTADILEGQGDEAGVMVRWCRVCGAVAIDHGTLAHPPRRGDWRRPRPTWTR